MSYRRHYACVCLLLCSYAAGQASAPAAPRPAAAPNTTTDAVVPAPEPQPAYVPLTSEQKFHRFVHSAYAPYTFTTVLLSSGYSQMVGDWPSYGGGMEGFGKRFGATLTDTEAANLFRVFLLPTVLRTDPRYFPSHKEGIIPRVKYSASRVLITRKDSGGQTFNTAEIVGTMFTKSLSNAYYPERDRGFTDTLSRSFGAIASDAGTNMLREFWPDIRKLFVKHEPARMKKWEKRMPKVVTDTAGAAMGVPPEQKQPQEPTQKKEPSPPPPGQEPPR